MKSYSEFIQGIHHVVGESKHLNPDQVVSVRNREKEAMDKKIRQLAAELADKYPVDEDKIKKVLERMAADGDDLDDLEALENELRFKS